MSVTATEAIHKERNSSWRSGDQADGVAAALPTAAAVSSVISGRMRMGVGGEGGIRTHGEVSPTHAFQACSFSHSDTSPREACARADGIGGDDRPPVGRSQRDLRRISWASSGHDPIVRLPPGSYKTT